MIKNERQYRITKSQMEKFEQALRTLEATPRGDTEASALMQKVHLDALSSQLADLRGQVEEYEALLTGRRVLIEVESFDDLPQALIQARIASRLSQKDLADRLGMKEQQIQRYEATDYASVSLERLQEIVRALPIHIREDIFLPSAKISLKTLLRRLGQVGIDASLVLNRLLPLTLVHKLQDDSSVRQQEESSLILQAASIIRRVYGWTAADLFGTADLHLDRNVAGIARFKVAARADERKMSAYTLYAHYLALLTLDSTPSRSTVNLPTDWQHALREITEVYGSITLDNVLRYIWDLGIPILPLKDKGAFHGACWRVEWRNIIVLKQQTSAEARWIFDLLHELWHAMQHPEQSEFELIEEQETLEERRKSQEEMAASRFAGNVMLNGRAEDLAKQCVQLSGGLVQRLKSVVATVAAKAGVRADFLANYMAFRLLSDGQNWWGTAATFQVTDRDPWQIARDILLEHVDFDRLIPVDRNLLMQAMTNIEE